MSTLDLIQTMIEYDIAMTRQVWESISEITDEQFLQDEGYSRGSIRNLMVHLASTNRRFLSGLKNEADVGHLRFEDFPDRKEARQLFDSVSKDLHDYVTNLSEAEVEAKPEHIPNHRAEVLLHLVNHGTDHRSTVLQKLNELGAPTFDQDFISWLWQRERGE